MKIIMKIFILFIVIAFSTNSFSQVTLTSSNNPVPGNTAKSVTCDTTGIVEGNSGSNQSWNFAGIIRRDSSVNTFVASGTTPYAAQFPSSNVASTSDNQEYSYYTTSSSELLYNGYGSAFQVNSYNNPESILRYPFTFNSNFSDTYSSVYNNGVANSYLNGTITSTGDAWGTLVLPNGTFNNALRIKNVTSHRDSSFIGGVSNVLRFTSTAYTWFVPNRKFPVFEIRYNLIEISGFPSTRAKFVIYSPDNPTIGISQISTNIAGEYALSQNYPNPFNPSTKIRFDITSGDRNTNSPVRLTVHDQLGKEVATLVNENLSPGSYEYNWNAGDLAGGIYYYTLSAGNFSDTKKMILVK
jgi:hypothetical protein